MKTKEIENCTFIINSFSNKVFKKSKDKTCFYQVSPRSKNENNFIIKFDDDLRKFIPINHHRASEIINKQFRCVKEEWIFDGKTYKNCSAFGSKDVPFTLFDKLPSHHDVFNTMKLVYYRGDVFYTCWHNKNDNRCRLFDKNFKKVGYAVIKNCCPIVDKLGDYI